MATTQCKPGERLHQVKSSTPTDEAPWLWQQLMTSSDSGLSENRQLNFYMDNGTMTNTVGRIKNH